MIDQIQRGNNVRLFQKLTVIIAIGIVLSLTWISIIWINGIYLPVSYDITVIIVIVLASILLVLELVFFLLRQYKTMRIFLIIFQYFGIFAMAEVFPISFYYEEILGASFGLALSATILGYLINTIFIPPGLAKR